MKTFNKEKFLLYLLGGIFAFQAAVFGTGLFFCARNGGLSTCPKIGERYEQTFNVMIATTLALLTGSAVAGVSQKRGPSSEPVLPLDGQPRQLPQRRFPGTTSAPQDQAPEQVELLEQASSQALEPEQEEEKEPPKLPGKR